MPDFDIAMTGTPAATTRDGTGLIRSQAWHDNRVKRKLIRPNINKDEVVGYARYSTTGQREESIERQIENIQRAAAARKLKLVRMFIDREISGAKSDREGLSAMIAFLSNAESRPAMVFVEKDDRLARDLKIYVDLWDLLGKLGVQLFDVKNGPIDSGIKAALHGALSAEERRSILYRTQAGRESHAAKGLIMNGVAFGYDAIPGKPGEWTINPAEGAVVRRVFDMRLSGMSFRQISRELEIEGGPGGRLWYTSSLRGMLANPIYMGVYVYKRTKMVTTDDGRTQYLERPLEEVIQAPVPHLRIVDVETWDKVQEVRSKAPEFRKPRDPQVPIVRGKYLLQGKAICSECRQPMRACVDSYEKPRWRCASNADRASHVERSGCGNGMSYHMAPVEGHILSALAEMLERDDFERLYLGAATTAAAARNDRVRAELDASEARLRQIADKLVKSFDEAVTSGLRADTMATIRSRLEEEADGIRARVVELRAIPREEVRDPSGLLALRGALDELASRVPFVPEDAAGHALRKELRGVIGPVVVTRGDGHGSLDIEMSFDFLGNGAPDGEGMVRVTRSHHLDLSDTVRQRREAEALRAVEARTYAISDERWSALREHVPAIVGARHRRGELMARLLIECVLVAATTGAPKSTVYRLMRRKWEIELRLHGAAVQKLGGFEELQKASHDGHLPEVGPLDLARFEYWERPNRQTKRGPRKIPAGGGLGPNTVQHADYKEKVMKRRHDKMVTAIEERSFAVSDERWAALREHVPGILAVWHRRGELAARLLVEAASVTSKTGASKYRVNTYMTKKFGAEFKNYSASVQKQGGYEQLQTASRDGHLPEVGPLDLAVYECWERPSRRKQPGPVA